MIFEDVDLQREVAKIKVFGVGGGGNSVLSRMAEKDLGDVELVALNTDEDQLTRTKDAGVTTLLIGQNLTKGRGSGGNIEVGAAAAEVDASKIRDKLHNTNLLFITAALGGGVGTGASPVVARIAKDMGILTVGVVTLPFTFEGSRRMKNAKEGIQKLQADLDALLIIHNDNLMKIADKKLSLKGAFESADEVLRQAIFCIAELILTTGTINVDFADVQTIFTQSRSCESILGIGRSRKSALEAVKQAVASPLLDKSLEGARGIILNITADKTLPLLDVSAATTFIEQTAAKDVNIIFGIVVDDTMGDLVQATIIATDFVDSTTFKSKRENKIIVPLTATRAEEKKVEEKQPAEESKEEAKEVPQAKPAVGIVKEENSEPQKEKEETPPQKEEQPVTFEIPAFLKDKSAKKDKTENNNNFVFPAFSIVDDNK